MSFPRYPAYKNSGVEWLGEVPEHWEQKKIKFLASFSGGGTPSRENLDYWDGNIPWVSPKDMKSESISTTEDLITIEGLINSASNIIPENMIIMVVRSGILKHTIPIAINKVSVSLNQDMKAISFELSRIDSVFFLRWVQGLNRELLAVWSKQGATVESLEHDYIANTVIALPPLPEQHTIAAFLDRETAKIDALVAEQETLIALLAEKRQATISHAVTKGLNPAVPMKDSGIEWLGAVPDHWEVLPLKRDLAFLTSGSRGWADHYSDDGALFLRIGNLTRDGIALDLSDIQRVEIPEGSEGERTRVNVGDVLFSITAYLGSVAVVPEDLETAYVSQHVALARLHQRYASPFWVAYVALSYIGKTYLATQGYGGTKIQLSLDDVANIPLTLPPLAEQQAIVAHLDRETARLDALTVEARRAIDLLKERRSALISAAVTGKIDVRGRGA